MTTIDDALQTVDDAFCQDHAPSVERPTREQIDHVVVGDGRCGCRNWGVNCGSWCDTESFALLALTDGRFFAVEESSDSTGHGCRCDGQAAYFATADEALRLGLSETMRERAVALLPKGGTR